MIVRVHTDRLPPASSKGLREVGAEKELLALVEEEQEPRLRIFGMDHIRADGEVIDGAVGVDGYSLKGNFGDDEVWRLRRVLTVDIWVWSEISRFRVWFRSQSWKTGRRGTERTAETNTGVGIHRATENTNSIGTIGTPLSGPKCTGIVPGEAVDSGLVH
ncbi:predicted protein [Sclerotinia sclerotiorum 1980 UF-70]|uniref:Uncharacterized protein n=1 Tax=Sclerotinia sclerotiorum (strain ATCC 18683 / 1980 / Ss-1) TaxID=665079 RepID=A7F2B4_SCLS1|nr:predicted protein [Sclerotinia sclerotiorum 1980 UF-70]EDN95856.1 predicted protein [Sclerotinia sclerotiorum 1980 UF-70]